MFGDILECSVDTNINTNGKRTYQAQKASSGTTARPIHTQSKREPFNKSGDGNNDYAIEKFTCMGHAVIPPTAWARPLNKLNGKH